MYDASGAAFLEYSQLRLRGGTTRFIETDPVARGWDHDDGGWTGKLEETDPDSGDFTYTFPDGLQFLFTGGKIDTITDRFGNAITATHNGSGQLTSIADTRGVSHTIAYYNTGRVKTITYADGRVWKFIYNVQAQLTRIEGPATTSFPNGIVREFRYINGSADGSLNNNMTVVLDGRGNHWLHNEYDTSDRVSIQKVGPADDLEFDYTNQGSQKTSVTDRAGNDRDWEWHSTKLTKTKLTQFSNRDVRSSDPVSWITEWTHDADGYLTEVELPAGNGTEFTLNSVKLPTSIRRKTDVDAANHATDLVTSIAYDDMKFWGRTSSVDPEGNQTDFTLNSDGQPTQIDYPDSTHISPSQEISETLTYNANGTLASRTDGEGKKTSYAYYTTPSAKKGRVHTVKVDDGTLDLVTTYDYTDWGAVKEVTDPEGNKTTYTVEAYGNVTKIAYPTGLGYETKFAHDGNLNVTLREVKNIDENGTAQSTPLAWWDTHYTYTEMDRMLQANEAIGASTNRITNYTYDANDHRSSVAVSDVAFSLHYDERDLLHKRVGDEGAAPAINAVHEYAYDANGNLSQYTDPRSKATLHEYDGFDRRDKTINAITHYVETVYDKNSNVTERKWFEEAGTTDVLMAHRKSTYDELDRFFKEEAALIDTTTTWVTRTLELDKRGLVTKRTNRRNDATTFTYDGAGRRIGAIDPEGSNVGWAYDDNGNVTKLTETEAIPGSQSTEAFVTDFEFDAINRRTKQLVVDRTLSTNKHVTEWKWNSRNVVAKTIDPMVWNTTLVHDGLGRVTKQTRDMSGADDIVTEWTYDDLDNVTQLKDDNANTTGYAYDDLGRLTTTTYDDLETATYAYDDANNVIDFTDQNGTNVDCAYDDINRLTDRDATLGSGVGGDTAEDFAYDALDRLTEAKDNDSIVQYTYDSLSRALTEKQGPNPFGSAAKTVTFTFDAEGNSTKIAYPSGFEARRKFDTIHRLTAIDDKTDAGIADFDLYGAGARRKQVSFANGTTSSYLYDGFRRQTDLAHANSGATEFAGFEYGWDKNDNPLYETRRHQSNAGDAYGYDQANRLIEVLQDATNPANPTVYVDKIDYNLDDVLNFTSVVTTPQGGSAATVSFTSNGMNEYSAVGGTSRTFDDNGNLTDDGTYEYTYDWHNHLIKVEDSGTTDVVATYSYDAVGRGRRIEKVVGSDTTRFIYADQQCLEELDGSDDLLRVFAFGEALDEIVMMEAADVADVDADADTTELKRFYYHQQLVGSVTHITDPDEVVVESYDYGPYGESTIFDIGSSVVSGSQIGNPFLYTARRLDEETGLFYYRARHYDPENARFLQRDPLEYVDGPNARAYVSGGPTSRTDPLGLSDKKDKKKAQAAKKKQSDYKGRRSPTTQARPTRRRRTTSTMRWRPPPRPWISPTPRSNCWAERPGN